MGRRSKADLLGLLDRIFTMSSSEKMTNDQIADQLQAEGIDISKSAIQRSLKSTKEVAAELSATTAETTALINAVRENPNTDVIEATTALLSRKLFDYMKSVDELSFDDADKLAVAIHRAAQSQTQISKLRLTFQKGFKAAQNAVLTALKNELKNHPDLFIKLSEIVSDLASPEA